MTATPVAIGIDNGGSWIRICVRDQQGQTLQTLREPSPPLDKLPQFLAQHLSRWDPTRSTLAIGSKGVWETNDKMRLEKKLKKLARSVVVMSDVEAAWFAAFAKGQHVRSGILLISGTGSIAYGHKIGGKTSRAGGLGPLKGDEGSGYWIGRKWLGKQPTQDPAEVRQIAAQARRVVHRATRGDKKAAAIVDAAVHELLLLVKRVAQKTRMQKPLTVSPHGSVLQNPWFQKQFRRGAKKMGVPLRPFVSTGDVAKALTRISLFALRASGDRV